MIELDTLLQTGSPAPTSVVVDLGPLSWVADSLRDTLHGARDQLLSFSEEVQAASGSHLTTLDTTSVRMTAQSLHEAVGVLDLVERPAAAKVVGAMERSAQLFVSHPERCTPEAAQQLAQAGTAVLDYLTSVLKGQPDWSVGLFPAYREVAQLAGLDRIHPADLWHAPWQWLEIDAPMPAPTLTTQPRPFLESVLQMFRSGGTQGAAELAVHAQQLWEKGNSSKERVFWQLANGFLQLLSVQALRFDDQVKRLLSRLSVQYDLLQQGSSDISERLAQDLLFFVALGHSKGNTAQMPLVRAIAQHYRFDDFPVNDYDQLLYGTIDPAQREQLRETVIRFKELWSDVCSGDTAKANALNTQASALAQELGTLWPATLPFSAALQALIDPIVQTGQLPHPDVAMEVATAILFLEATAQDRSGNVQAFEERMETLTRRLETVRQTEQLAPLTDWMEALYAQFSDQNSMTQVVAESRTTIGEVEQALDDFFRHPQKTQQAAEAIQKLEKITGVLLMLNCQEASQAVATMAQQVQQLIEASQHTASIDDTASQETILQLGNSLGTLSFMLDMMVYQPDLARAQFHFDTEKQELVHQKIPLVSVSAFPENIPTEKPAAVSSLAETHIPALSELASAQAEGTLSASVVTEQLGNVIHQAELAGQPALAQQARQALTGIQEAGTESPDTLAQAVSALAPAAPPPSDGISDTPIEEEDLRDIFLEEAEEVIGNAHNAIEALHDHLADTTQLTNLRRAFHTLKGSGRMVGLASFGEAAWEIERMFNAWLADTKPATKPLLQLAENALDVLTEWRTSIARQEQTHWHHVYFGQSAAAMLENGAFVPITAAPAAESPATQEPSTVTESTSLLEPGAEAPASDDAESTIFAPETEIAAAKDIEVPLFTPKAEPIVVDTDIETPLFAEEALAPIEPIEPIPAEALPAEDATALFAPETKTVGVVEGIEAPLFAPETESAITSDGTEPALFTDEITDNPPSLVTPEQAASFTTIEEHTRLPDSGVNTEAMTHLTQLLADLPSLDLTTPDANLPTEQQQPSALDQATALTESTPRADVPLFAGSEPPASASVPAKDAVPLFAPESETASIVEDIDTPLFADEAPKSIEPILAEDTPAGDATALFAPEIETTTTTDGIEPALPAEEQASGIKPDAATADHAPMAWDDIAALDAATANVSSPQPKLLGSEKSQTPITPEPAVMPPSQPGPSTPQNSKPTGSAALKSMLVDTGPQQAVLHDMIDGLPDDEIKHIGEMRIPLALFNAYLSEADTWSRQLVQDLGEWALDYTKPAPNSCGQLAHSLAGSSAAVGIASLASTARGIEHAIAHINHRDAQPAEVASLVEAADIVRQGLHQFAAGLPPALDMPMLCKLAAIVENVSPDLIEAPLHTVQGTHPLKSVPEGEKKNAEATVLSDALTALEKQVDTAPTQPAGEASPVAPQANGVEQASTETDLPAPASPTQAAVASSSSPAQTTAPATAPDVPVDAMDPELFEIFQEEAQALMPQLSAVMRQWVARPDNEGARTETMRLLHTLKGGARLAGAMQLGAMAHEMESAIGSLGKPKADNETAEALEQLQSMLDELDAHFRQLTHPTMDLAPLPASATNDSPSIIDEPQRCSANASSPSGGTSPATALAPLSPDQASSEVAMPVSTHLPAKPLSMQQQVRVRSRMLDRMLNSTGEVITSRARLEKGVQQLREAMQEMDGSLDRLRTQLRDMELQAETQMQSRMAQSTDTAANFDPLEFDRFTRVQELTRMMAESVNDVASVQRNMVRTVQASEDNLIAQARQARELQDDLLRTRMVEFDSLSERLYRVVRQAARESDKQVTLDIAGGQIEMDRTIIERMAAPFEHLLRNAVVHGIETPEQRAHVGKEAAGHIAISLRQEGNDVAISVQDDGRGLDVQRIREKAIDSKLLADDAQISDEETTQLIFHSGLSTASAVTSLAGRGVGLDVVRAEIHALGGRIETQSRQHLGTTFTLVLPLTTAVTQVVELQAGELRFGVPSSLIESVRRATAKEIQQAYNAQTFTVDGENLPFYWAGAMLQASRLSSDMRAKRQMVLVLRSAAQRIVMHVDAVLGNQEVVVKNIGPQLARMPGLTGITILPSGALLFIYNPIALSFVYDEQIRAFGSDRADPAVLGGERPAATPAVSQEPLILVVDDSITVRRVTERLLKRQGYRVALATDGIAALRALAVEKPAVVLSDIEMPQMDGFDLLRNIRNDDALHDLPVIMITSRSADKHREHAQALGATDFLGKPYAEERLLELLRQHAQALTA